MMENTRPEEENIIKDVRNLFRLEKLKKKQFIPQIKISKISLDQKKKIKQLKTEQLQILETLLDQRNKIKELKTE